MTVGLLEVAILDARDLRNTDFLGNMDPYVVIHYKNEERKTSVARAGQGRSPEWNETLKFRVEYPGGEGQYKLVLRIMDKDTFSSDDFVGEATIYVEDLLALGVENGKAELRPTKYRVVLSDMSYAGEIRVGLSYTPKVTRGNDEFEVGGWKESDY